MVWAEWCRWHLPLPEKVNCADALMRALFLGSADNPLEHGTKSEAAVWPAFAGSTCPSLLSRIGSTTIKYGQMLTNGVHTICVKLYDIRGPLR